MKTIAVLTMAFLPATFVSTLFSANLFTLDADAAWRVYVAVVIPLTLLTLGIWGCWQGWKLKRMHSITVDAEKKKGV